jgi:hypothetical protein
MGFFQTDPLPLDLSLFTIRSPPKNGGALELSEPDAVSSANGEGRCELPGSVNGMSYSTDSFV